MPRKPNSLQVKKYIADVVELCDVLCGDNNKREGGVRLPPAYETYVRQIRIYGEAILRKHAAKKTRKDIYIET